MKKINLFFPLIFVLSFFLFTSEVRSKGELPLIPRTEVFSSADKNLVKISQDGMMISYLADLDGHANLFIAPLDSPEKAEALFKKEDGSILNYEWAFTKEHLLYLSGKNGVMHLFVLDLKTGEKRNLTPAENENIRMEKLSPDLPEEILISKGENTLYRINFKTGEKQLVLENKENFSAFLTDNKFRPVVAQRQTAGGGFDLFKRDEEGGWKAFVQVPWQNARDSRPFSVDRGGETLFMVDNLTTDKAVLKSYALKTTKSKILLEDEKADLTSVLMVNPVSAQVESATAYYGDMRRHYLDNSVKKDFDFLQTKHAGDVGIAGRSFDDKKWLVVYLDGGPLRYFSYDRRTKAVNFLFSSHKILEKYDLAKREMAEIKTRDGLKFPAHLYLPPNIKRGKEKLPLLIYVHGGPTVAYPWNSFYTNRIFQLLTNRGYAVLRVEFRGTGGFGKKIADAGNLEWGKKMHEDLLDAADWAVKEGITEKERIGIYGWSYGGYATLAALTFTPDKFACGIALYPVSDLKALLDQSPFFWRIKLGDERTPEGEKLLRETSPLFYVKNIKKPLLVTHGGRDTRATPYHSDVFVEEMKKQNKPVTYLYYPEEVHDYRLDENWVSFFAVAERFLAEALGGRFEPVGEDLNDVAFEIKAGKDLIPGLAKAEKTKTSKTSKL